MQWKTPEEEMPEDMEFVLVSYTKQIPNETKIVWNDKAHFSSGAPPRYRIVTIEESGYSTYKYVDIGYWEEGMNQWAIYNSCGELQEVDVYAWMELPDPA